MLKVTVLGGGKLAKHLISVFLETEGIYLQQVYNRTIENIQPFSKFTSITNNIENLKKSDIYIICIRDNQIHDFSKKLKNLNGLIVHTSGAMDMNVLQPELNRGVFYPLQSFSENKKVNFENIPFCIETENSQDLFLLEELGAKISKKVFKINSSQRKKLHVAAVFVNNFVNHLYQIGEDICESNAIPFEILHPLILETATKIENLSPKQAQTGPAIRNDQKTIEVHKKELSKDTKEIYSLLTKAIIKTQTHGNKL